jgi:2-polyprenyl-6-methoxyphenol hydroxylase-like FAD-dependent oxidoreductase
MRSIPFSEHAVIVVGGGPTGLMLAGELALAGVDVAIVERRLDHRCGRNILSVATEAAVSSASRRVSTFPDGTRLPAT